MRRSFAVVGLLVALASAVVACAPTNSTMPPGAALVHVTVAGPEVVLEPATVRAGDVYVMLDTPRSAVGFVQAMRSAAETPGPLTDEDLARLATGDTQGTSIGGFDLLGCSDEQRAEHLGQLGPCGNVFMERLTPGKYAFFVGDLEGPGDYSDSIAVLEVVP